MASKTLIQQTIKIDIPVDVIALCNIFDITPKLLLEQYMCDLCSLPGNGGSDERRMAKDYFLRGHISGNVHIEEKASVIEEFETLYQNNYPSLCNTSHATRRMFELMTMHDRIMSLQSGKL